MDWQAPLDMVNHLGVCSKRTDLEPLAVARLLAAVAAREAPLDMVLMGKQAVDNDSNQTVSVWCT